VKVTDEIARARHALPGIDLISPPPLHDLYSIEDLKQLIYELRQVHPTARVSVKLVSGAGIGTIAVGVAKAGADTIHISGGDGGTGAAGLMSMKHAGLPWEIGLVEAHRTLVANGLRKHVKLRVDGGLATGKDVVLAAILGGEEFDFGKILLVAEGCVMARICEKNTCPTGIATHNPRFKAKYKGSPDHVVRLLEVIAQDTRRTLARMGFTQLGDVLGRTDLLCIHAAATSVISARHLELSYLLGEPKPVANSAPNLFADDISSFNQRALKDAQPAVLDGKSVRVSYGISTSDRAAFATVAGAWAQRQEVARLGTPLSTGMFEATVTGSAGQGFGVFTTEGMALRLHGEANDSVGKTMSGGLVVVRPHPRSRPDAGDDVIIGNYALYGATGGALLVRGQAGDRFAVRNSGATAVVEGVGLHCCEYMTGGCVLVLGPMGANAGAGMTGGVLYVWSDDEPLVHTEYVRATALDADDDQRVKELLERHARETESPRARHVLEHWAGEKLRVRKYMPRTAPLRVVQQDQDPVSNPV